MSTRAAARATPMAQELEDKFKRDDDRGEEHALGMEENVQGVNNTAGDGDIQEQPREQPIIFLFSGLVVLFFVIC